MAFSKGRTSVQVEIDTKADVLRSLIIEFPSFVNNAIENCEKQIKEDAQYVAEGDPEIEWSMLSSHPLNVYEDILLDMTPFVYQALISLIYSYAESTLRAVCGFPQKIKGRNCSEIEKLFQMLQENYNQEGVNNIENVKYYWSDFDEFRCLRNSLVHKWRDSEEADELWKTSPQKYLNDNLDTVHTMLREIEKVVSAKQFI